MGLPLYIAPVESDIHNKSSSKIPAHARTAIRRYARHRSNEATRESRRRALAAAAVYQATDPWLLRSRSASDEPGAAAPSTTSNPVGSSGPQPTEPGRTRDSLRDFIGSRMGLDDRTASLFGERWAGLHPHVNSGPARDELDDTQNALLEAALAPDTWGMSILDSNATRRRAILQADPEPSRRRLPPSPPPPPLRRLHSREFMRGAPPIPRRSTAGSGIRARRSAYAARPSLPHEPTERPQEGRFDGLGDRNRSLSPEADDVWDTLLSTLTPDPQPPSVGSSFASASASAAASQTAGSQSVAAGSSSTSLTGPDPDPAEDSNMEPPCESGCEHSDTEGDDDDDDDDDDLEQNTLTRFPPGLRHSRSYADVAARATGAHSSSSNSGGGNGGSGGGGGGGDEALEFLGGMGGMQRIVRNLARREDIPDEWWAEAGLSRSLSREGSA